MTPRTVDLCSCVYSDSDRRQCKGHAYCGGDGDEASMVIRRDDGAGRGWSMGHGFGSEQQVRRG